MSLEGGVEGYAERTTPHWVHSSMHSIASIQLLNISLLLALLRAASNFSRERAFR